MSSLTPETGQDLSGWVGQQFNLDASTLRSYFYEHREIDAVQHLFRVASSLDSMVVGEPQILGQVKNAYAAGRLGGTIGPHLEKLLQSAFFVAKKVRTETQVGNASVSIASVNRRATLSALNL
ncbi:hypothetical protein H7849_06995 [Alloacidobacterium dinghuense]|uniref:Glutamyl-tRNA reductase N-terminal domain-containing protein n=1 Tax=Alloacidobacterium dinghuense TaxID=2763107 RepID=A0A7G8BM98_9BACT|nr:hypothetical protein [Alloacidobacterium dinghuense]QNI33668.1 hypothetical protein H7849_06995 [Alloacidobacterium dinghuense]